MKALVSFIAVTLIIIMECSQTSTYAKFINSFPLVNSNTFLRFGVAVGTGSKMTSAEALVYVYDKDSTKLYCKQKIFNMETEKVEGISKELYLPQKCLRIKTKDFMVIGYSAFECQDPNKPLKQFLILNIIDASTFQVTDSLLVHSGNDYGSEMTGLINPKNRKVFILKQIGPRNRQKQAFMYKISDALKFEIERQQSNIENMTDDLEKDIELIGWKEVFLN